MGKFTCRQQAVALMALATGISQPALADTVSAINSASETIVVTAAKKAQAEDAQVVPLAVSVLAGDDLAERKVRTLSDLTHLAPGVSLDQVGTFRGTANWSIRGLGINSSIASIEPAVGTFVDGVYIGINPGASLDLFDMARVEVLRGPQGTLYGHNVTGGAVLLETANPTRDWHFTLRGSGDGPVDAGRGAMNLTMSAALSGPISESLSFRLAGYHNSDGGWFRNRLTGGNLGAAETDALRGSLLFESGPLRLLAKAEWLKTEGDGAVGQNHGLFSRHGFGVSLDNPGFIRARSRSASLRADLELGTGQLTNIFGWRDYRQFTSNDIDATPTFLFNSQTGLVQDQWSNELRWAGQLGETVQLTLGGYAFGQDIGYDEDRLLPLVTALRFYGGGRQSQKAWGLFGQADWALAPSLTLTAGLRWSTEDKAANVTFVRTRPACSAIAATCPVSGTNPTIPGESNGFSDKHSWQHLSPKLGLSWRPAEDVMAYGSWARAYRSGGYNLRIAQPAAFLANALASGTPAFGAERVDSAELGLKLRRGLLTFNLAAYETRVRGMQREVNQASGGSGTAQSVYNTANARIRGFEAEAMFDLGSNLHVSANLGHIDARYTKALYDISSDGVISAADLALRLPRVPKWTWGLAVQHTLQLGEVSKLESRVQFQRRSRYAYTDNNFGWVGASDSLDADLTWHLPVTGFTLALYGRNLLDEVQFGGDTQVGFGAGPFSDGNNRPFDPRPSVGTFSPLAKGRTVGVEAAITF